MTATILAFLLATMQAWLPPAHVARGAWPELRHETPAQTNARYLELAEAAYSVAFAEENAPLFDEDEPDRGDVRARTRTAVLLLSLAYYESGFHNRVTTLRGKDRKRSDGGRSWCAVQIMLDRHGIGNRGAGGHLRRLIPEGWTGRQLEADPEKCLTVGYRFAAASLARYGSLAGYTGERGSAPKARHRLARAARTVLPDLAGEAAPEPTAPDLGALAGEPPPF